MWLITTLSAAIIFSLLHLKIPKYRFEVPSLMSWGTVIMILIDKIIAAIEGEPFIEITTDGLITNSTVLGLLMLIPILVVWIVVLLIKKPRA
jgi:hypothetical protein